VLQSGYCQFTADDKQLEVKLSALWAEFQFQLQDAVKRVTLQAPVVIQTLDDELQVCLLALFYSTVNSVGASGCHVFLAVNIKCSVIYQQKMPNF